MNTCLLTLLLFLLPSLATATEAPSLTVGKALFHSPHLGSSGNSCAGCHHAGRGLENLTGWQDGMLKDQINDCVTQALKGSAFDTQSTEMESILLYLRSLQPAAN